MTSAPTTIYPKKSNKKTTLKKLSQKPNQQQFSQKVLKKFQKYSGMSDLPDDLKISTISITFHFPTDFNIKNIARYINLHKDSIISVKLGNNCEFIRTLGLTKKKKSKKKTKNKQKKLFYNQATIEVMSKYKPKKPTNVKIFNNGSGQMAGCVSIENCLDVLQTLCTELKQVKATLDAKQKKIIKRPFSTKHENLKLEKITKFQIDMINSNFNIGFKIDRSKLHKIMICDNVECTFEPCVHACVNIKYNYKNEALISVFVFESGAIIITGAKNRDHIVSAHIFIIKKLYEHYHDVVEADLNSIIQRTDVRRQLNLDPLEDA